MRLLGPQPSIGQVLSCLQEPVRVAPKFKALARLIETADESPIITPGFRCMLHLHHATEECEVLKIVESVDPRTKKKETAPKIVRAPLVALCVLGLRPAGREIALQATNG